MGFLWGGVYDTGGFMTLSVHVLHTHSVKFVFCLLQYNATVCFLSLIVE